MYKITDTNERKTLQSPGYNWTFDKQTGLFVRIGRTADDDPEFSPYGPEIADIEISAGRCSAGCAHCFPPGTVIYANGKNVPIEKIKVGDSVTSMDVATGKLRLNEVKEIYSREYDGELIEIEFEWGKVIRVTPEHPLRTTDGRWVLAKDVQAGDDLVAIKCGQVCKTCATPIVIGTGFSRHYCSDVCFVKAHMQTCSRCSSAFVATGKQRILCPTCFDYSATVDKLSHPLMPTYQAMIQRCYNPERNVYYAYGEKGIGVCDRWMNFDNFIADVGERPEGHTLDRVDNAKGYSPENCRWATVSEQRTNRRKFKSSKCRYKGVRQHGSRWIAVLRINSTSVYLGIFESEELAANAVNVKLIETHGDRCLLSYLNQIGEAYESFKNSKNIL